MEFKQVFSNYDRELYIRVAQGHFATNHSHINTYVDLTHIKTNLTAGRRAAKYLATPFQQMQVDTILCLEGTIMLGAYLADELGNDSNMMGINRGMQIHVLAPELNSNKQMIFQQNTKHMIHGKNIILMLSSVSTGKTINRALDCLQYYDGRLTGIAVGFSAAKTYGATPIHALFTADDLDGYHSYLPKDCPICKSKPEIDAIVNENGFTYL